MRGKTPCGEGTRQMRRSYTITRDLGDGGAWERKMVHQLSRRVSAERDARRRLADARQFVAECKGSYLDVFDAIVRNGKDRAKSIREISNRRDGLHAAHRRYYRGRNALIELLEIHERLKLHE